LKVWETNARILTFSLIMLILYAVIT
jgi:hypothetical protein